MSTRTNNSVVLGLDIEKTKKTISVDLKKVLKSLDSQTIDPINIDARQITRTITEALQQAYKKATGTLPPLELQIVPPKIDSFRSLADILDNWDSYMQMLDKYAESFSSAMEKNSNATDNWAKSVNTLRNAWKETFQDLKNSGSMSSLIDHSARNASEILETAISIGTVINKIQKNKGLGKQNQFQWRCSAAPCKAA